jgi:hypothetical protein
MREKPVRWRLDLLASLAKHHGALHLLHHRRVVDVLISVRANADVADKSCS